MWGTESLKVTVFPSWESWSLDEFVLVWVWQSVHILPHPERYVEYCVPLGEPYVTLLRMNPINVREFIA